MQKRIYIDTSIPSNYYTLRTDEISVARKQRTRQWWSEYAGQSNLVSSAITILELRRGTSEATSIRLDLLKFVEMLPITGEIARISQIYIQGMVMPEDPSGDALHLAIASFHEVDAILTWNCKHLANPNKIDFIRQINQKLGLHTPQLMTPLDYLGETI